MKVTIKDVAEKSGYTISTVSKALRGIYGVNDITREHIKSIANEMGYIPNEVAASLSGKNNKKIALIINVTSSQNIDEKQMQYILGGISKTTSLLIEYSIIIANELFNDPIDVIIRKLVSRNITGIVFFGTAHVQTQIEEIVKSEMFKCAVVDYELENRSTIKISINHEAAQYEVAKQLIETNNLKKVLYLAGKTDGFVAMHRLKAIRKIEEDLKVKIFYENAEFEECKAYSISKKYLDKVDGIICASDIMAVGAYSAMKEKNTFLPLSGFDGISLLNYLDYPIITVHQDFSKVSEIAVTAVFDLLTDNVKESYSLDYYVK